MTTTTLDPVDVYTGALAAAEAQGFVGRGAMRSALTAVLALFTHDAEVDEFKRQVLVLTKQLGQTEKHLASVRATLRIECEDLGSTDWPDNLHLGDVVEKHLARPVRHRLEQAEAALRGAGYVRSPNGEHWVPAIGKRPDFERIDELTAQVAGWQRSFSALHDALLATLKDRPPLDRMTAERAAALRRAAVDLRATVNRRVVDGCDTRTFTAAFWPCLAALDRALAATP